MTPEKFEAWRRVLRDFAIVGIGAFMLIYGTLHSRQLSAPILTILLGGGFTAFGLLPVLYSSGWRITKNGDEDKQ